MRRYPDPTPNHETDGTHQAFHHFVEFTSYLPIYFIIDTIMIMVIITPYAETDSTAAGDS